MTDLLEAVQWVCIAALAWAMLVRSGTWEDGG